MPDLLNIALSGLNAHKIALSTTGNNIANANTEGYSRQQAVLDNRTPQIIGSLALGAGTQVNAIRRTANEFAINQLRNDTAVMGETNTTFQNMSQLDQLFSDPNMGLNTGLNNFFASLQAASDSPVSAVSRQALLSESERLVNRFHSMNSQLSIQNTAINNQINGATEQITQLASGIADINLRISEMSGAIGGDPVGLLDQRDELLRQMSELVGINVIEQDNQGINVFIGNGQALVLGTDYVELATADGEADRNKKDIVIKSGQTTTRLKSGVSGGILGGLLEFRDGALNHALNDIGRMAIVLADSMNAQHHLGMDMSGNLGTNYFNDINSEANLATRTISSSSNTQPQDHQVVATIIDTGQLNASDYSITFKGDNIYEITRLRDGKINNAIDPSLTGNLNGIPSILNFDGLEVAFNRASGNFLAGDSFTLRPTLNAASQLQLAISNKEQLALAAPIRTGHDINNIGTGTVSAGIVTSTSVAMFTDTAGELSPPLLVQFTSATTYDILDNSNPNAPVALIPPLIAQAFPPASGAGILPTSFGIDINISGQPQAGDTFTVSFNSGGYQDNRNSLAMINLQNANIIDNNSSSLTSSYGNLMQEIGSQAAEAAMNQEASSILLEQSRARRDSISGVNIDEEAANLIRFENAYNASAQVINVARTIFDTLINAVR